MQYKPLSQSDRIEKAIILTNKIIVKALQSDRGDIIRVMNDADLKMMKDSVARVVRNILEVESQRAYAYKYDPTAGFKLISDVEIEKEVTAYFEINGKLQYREVSRENIIVDLSW